MSEPIVQSKTDRPSPRKDEQELRAARFAMRLSLIVGLVMLGGKTTAYFMTHSAAILSDAAESVIHVVASVITSKAANGYQFKTGQRK